MKVVTCEFFVDGGNEYRFRLVAPNGRKLAVSEAYSSKAKAIQGALAIFEVDEVRFKGLEKPSIKK